MLTSLEKNPSRRNQTALAVRAIYDSAEVSKNLEISVATLLATNPEVKLDWHLAEAVLEARVFSRQLAWLRDHHKEYESKETFTLKDFLSKFINDSSRQDFLAFYIEAWKHDRRNDNRSEMAKATHNDGL